MGTCSFSWKKRIQPDNQYADKMDMPDTDDEHAWIGGIFYYNPKDTHTIVSKKIGMGTTINMATPAGKATALIKIIALLNIPICCVWVMLEEFTPISKSCLIFLNVLLHNRCCQPHHLHAGTLLVISVTASLRGRLIFFLF